jgi:hypothetical protein
MKTYFRFLVLLGLMLTFPCLSSFSQVSISDDNSIADPSAMLDVKSITKGVLIPRMTHAQLDAIPAPADGLMVFCTNCGTNEIGSLSIFIAGAWNTFNANCLKPLSPAPSVHVAAPTQIVWNWNAVPNVTGYKWNTANDYASATDMLTATTRTETELISETVYTRYIWAYNSCGESPLTVLMQTTNPPEMPTITTTAFSGITETTATSGGNVTSDGGASVIVRGVCWSTSPNPITTGSHTSDGSGSGAFASSLTGLSGGALYYVRAYATNSVGTSYGNELTFSTLASPIVITATVTNINTITATCGGTVNSDGGATVTARGVCWSTSPNPVTTGSHTTDDSGTGTFVSNLTGLTAGTQYYIRAYATNSVGTSYGNGLAFTTLTLPTVTTTSVTDIGQTTATGGGSVTSDGGAPVIARGICWSIYPGPTITGSHTTDGTGTGAFVSSITGLAPNNTRYYVRAYATTSVGTAYGSQVNFLTIPYAIGQSYAGGKIFYIDGTGAHGLIVATVDQGTNLQFGCNTTFLAGTSTIMGSGQNNTTVIVSRCSTSGIPARICNDLVLNGYSDWFLPSRDELNQLYLQSSIIGGFGTGTYWSSSEIDSSTAWYQFFSNGGQGAGSKAYSWSVRAIRVF